MEVVTDGSGAIDSIVIRVEEPPKEDCPPKKKKCWPVKVGCFGFRCGWGHGGWDFDFKGFGNCKKGHGSKHSKKGGHRCW